MVKLCLVLTVIDWLEQMTYFLFLWMTAGGLLNVLLLIFLCTLLGIMSQLVLQQETSISKVSVEPRAGTQDYSSENLDVTMHDREAKSQGEDGILEDVPQINEPSGKNGKEKFPSKSLVSDLYTHERGQKIESTQPKGKAEIKKNSPG